MLLLMNFSNKVGSESEDKLKTSWKTIKSLKFQAQRKDMNNLVTHNQEFIIMK